MTAGTSYGAEGGYSEAYQAGANVAADQAMQSRSRGLGKGGLASQRQELALMQTQSNALRMLLGILLVVFLMRMVMLIMLMLMSGSVLLLRLLKLLI
jgi:hypothetical protein